MLLTPAAAAGLLAVRGQARTRSWGRLALSGASALLVVGACAWLSVWMQAQSPILVGLREILREPGPLLPIASVESTPPDRWTVEQRQTYVVRATNLGARTWTTTSPGRVLLHTMFVGPEDSETVDTRVETRLPISRDVPPGQQIEMELQTTAPRKEGTYRLRHQLELEEQPGLSGSPPAEARVTVNVRRGR
jgi:hypothetical protein